MLSHRVESVKAGVPGDGEGRTPRLRTISCLVALAATILILVRNELAVADLGHGERASVGPISGRIVSTWVDEDGANESSTHLFTDFGPTPFVAGWSAGLACLVAGGVSAIFGLLRGRRRRVFWPWLLCWSLHAIGAGALLTMVVLNARANSTNVDVDSLSIAAMGAAVLAGVLAAVPWHRLRASATPEEVAAAAVGERQGGVANHDAPPTDAQRTDHPWLRRRRLWIAGGAIAAAALATVVLAGRRSPTYDTYEDFLERGRSAADVHGSEFVTRSSLISTFGVPALVKPDYRFQSDAHRERWFYELKAGGAAALQIRCHEGAERDRVTLEDIEYLDPGAFAKTRR